MKTNKQKIQTKATKGGQKYMRFINFIALFFSIRETINTIFYFDQREKKVYFIKVISHTHTYIMFGNYFIFNLKGLEGHCRIATDE